MSRKVSKAFIKLFVAASCFAAPPSAQVAGATRRARDAHAEPAGASRSTHAQTTSQTTSEVKQDVGRVSARLERGGRVAVDNRTRGRIRVVGWDRDTVEATATSERGVEAVRVRIDESAGARLISLNADYADGGRFRPAGDVSLRALGRKFPNVVVRHPRRGRGDDAAPGGGPGVGGGVKEVRESPPSARPAAPAEPVSASPPPEQTPGEEPASEPLLYAVRPTVIDLEVRVPRHAEVETIRVIRSPVEVSGIETPVRVSGDKGGVRLEGVGAAEVRTTSGGVTVEGARGFVDVVTFGGLISVRNSRGDVRARSIDGRIQIECGGGRVDVTTAGGPVALSGVGGDVDVNTTSGDISYAGVIRQEGRYYMKSMTGRVEMFVGGQVPGFTAALSSYRGTISSDFALKVKEDASGGGDANRRRIGRHGDGRAQLTLDSFEGAVRLSKAAPGPAKQCR